MTDEQRIETAIAAMLSGDYGWPHVQAMTFATYKARLAAYTPTVVCQALALTHMVIPGRNPNTGDVVIIAETLVRYGHDVCHKAAMSWIWDVGESERKTVACAPARWIEACRKAQKVVTSTAAPAQTPLLEEEASTPPPEVREKIAQGMTAAEASQAHAQEVLARFISGMGAKTKQTAS